MFEDKVGGCCDCLHLYHNEETNRNKLKFISDLGGLGFRLTRSKVTDLCHRGYSAGNDARVIAKVEHSASRASALALAMLDSDLYPSVMSSSDGNGKTE
jgi:hypothetical protein